MYAQVLIARPARSLDRPFTYSIPERLRERIAVGSYVFVPFGKQRVPGYVVALSSEAPAVTLRPIISLLADEPLFDAAQLELALWMARLYRVPLGDALRCVLPPGAARQPAVTVELTAQGRSRAGTLSVAGAPLQRQTLGLLQSYGASANRQALIAAARKRGLSPDQVTSAITALERRGLVAVHRGLRPPAAREQTRLVAALGEADEAWPQVIESLTARAPRQAEVVERLLQADDESVPVGELNRAAVKALQMRGMVRVFDEQVERFPDVRSIGAEAAQPLRLTGPQAEIVGRVVAHLDNREYAGLLIHGVTGSGKTEVYLQSIEQALRRGRDAIVLVPEISLTPQMVGRFRERFGDRLALLHSALGAGERFDQWQRVSRGQARIVVGARSAVFAPVRDLGIIVVDEEHETAYKQSSPPRYHARSAALERARRAGAVLLMGSATPSIESYYRACNGETAARAGDDGLSLVSLPERIDDRPMPQMEVIDLRGETLLGRGQTFSQRIAEEIQQRIDRQEQVILFLNRRGFATFVLCSECGHSLRCPDCAVALIYHHASGVVRCHHCDYTLPVPDQCPNCNGYDIGFLGLGTERVADQVQRQFHGAIVARMDRDTVTHKGAYGDTLRRFARGEANVLVGTQMVAKGHHFPAVTLVAVLNADTGLNRPDFRAAEQTFALLTQVSGRAGREDKPGLAIVQTYNPEHPAIALAAAHDYPGFYAQELQARRANLYPPFAVLANLVFSGEDPVDTLRRAQACAARLDGMGLRPKGALPSYLGPAQCPLHRLRGRFRYQLLIKAADTDALRGVLDELGSSDLDPGAGGLVVDVDPYDMM